MSDKPFRLTAATTAVVNFLTAKLPGAQTGQLTDVVHGLGLGADRMEILARYFVEHPDGLTSGRSDGPASRLRLLRALAGDYPGLISLPRCGGCGRAVRIPQMGPDGQRRCATCYARSHVEQCVVCGRTGRVARRDPQGQSVCQTCSSRDRSRWEVCSVCGKVGRVVTRTETGPLCENCRPRRTITCVACGRERPLRTYCSAGPLCSTCDARARRYECSLCHRWLCRAPRRGDDGQRVCDSCWQTPPIPCRTCGEVRLIKRRGPDGTGICRRCRSASAPQLECANCGRTRAVRARLPLGPVCATCNFYLRHLPAPCNVCQQLRPLIGIDGGGGRLCGPCSGQTDPWTCSACGRVAFRFSGQRCLTCATRQTLDEMLQTDSGEPHPQLHGLAEVFDVEGNPHAVLSWANKTKSARTLARLARQGVITHLALDTEPPSRHLDYLRQLLVFADVLPARNEGIEGTKRWLDDWLADADHNTSALLRRYTLWSLLRRARAREHRSTPTTGKNLRRRVIEARRWLEWLKSNDKTLPDARQADVDRWLAGGTQTRHGLRDFVLWTQREGLAEALQVPIRRKGQPEQFISDDHRWAALRRCSQDETIPTATRMIGGLLLLFGLPPGRVVRLTVDDLKITPTVTLVHIGKSPLLLPDPLASVAAAQLRAALTARTQVVKAHSRPAPRWLFPGDKYGHHLDAARCVVNMNRQLGIYVRPSRNTALCQWARDLPDSVLADFLGISPGTAAAWSALVQDDWISYVAHRANESVQS